MVYYLQAMLRRTGHQTQQAMQMRNRELEEERLASVKKLEREALVSKVLEDDDRLEEKRLMRRMMMEQREREMEDSIIRVRRVVCTLRFCWFHSGVILY